MNARFTKRQWSVVTLWQAQGDGDAERSRSISGQWSPGGFTLIELLVVIAIISILASLLMANFVGVRQRGRDAQRKSDLRQIQAALELYRADNGSYPTNLSACGSVFSYNSVTYMQKIPCDPLDATDYNYEAAPPGCDNFATPCTTYTIYACIENENDQDKEIGDTSCASSTNVVYKLTNP